MWRLFLFRVIAQDVAEDDVAEFGHDWLNFLKFHCVAAQDVHHERNKGDDTELREGAEEGLITCAKRQNSDHEQCRDASDCRGDNHLEHSSIELVVEERTALIFVLCD